MVDSKENDKFDLELKGENQTLGDEKKKKDKIDKKTLLSHVFSKS